MTDHLYVSFEYEHDDILALIKDIEEHVRIKCEGEIPNNKLASFRVNASERSQKISLEPFFGPASFIAQFARRKHRQPVGRALIELVECLQLVSSNIGVLFCSDDCEEEIKESERMYEIGEIVNLEKIPFQSKFFIKTPKVFYISKVEFKLNELIEIGDGQIVSSYFCSYYVCADNVESALDYVIESSVTDSFIGYGEISEVYPIALPNCLQELFDLHERGVFHRSGKVFF